MTATYTVTVTTSWTTVVEASTIIVGSRAVTITNLSSPDVVLSDGTVLSLNETTDFYLDAADTFTARSLTGTATLQVEDEGTTAVFPRVGGAFPAATCVIFGTSITNQNTFTSGNSIGYTARGYYTWANYYLRQRLYLLHNAGVSGNTTAQMLARISTDVLAYNPGWCIVEAGANDITTSVATATIITNFTTIYDTLRAAGIKVVACTILPNTNVNTTAMRTAMVAVNRAIKAYAWSNPDVVLCDWAGVNANPATGDPASGMTYDGTHPSVPGAVRLGDALFRELDNLLPKFDVLPSSFHDSVANAGNLLANGLMSGNVAGVATSWATSGGGVFTPTKVARIDNYPGEWQQMVCTSGVCQVFQQNTNVGVDWSVGDMVYAVGELEVDAAGFVPAAPPSTHFGFSVVFFGSSDTMFAARAASADEQYTVAPGNGVQMTPIATIPTGTTRLQFIMTAQGAMTYRLGRCGIWKVTGTQVF